MSRKFILYIFFISFSLISFAQNNSFLKGRVVDEKGNDITWDTSIRLNNELFQELGAYLKEISPDLYMLGENYSGNYEVKQYAETFDSEFDFETWHTGLGAVTPVGIGVDKLMEAIVERVPAPTYTEEDKLKCLIFDSYFDPYKGVIILVRIVDGSLNALDYQMSTLKFNLIDMSVRIFLILYLIPKKGIEEIKKLYRK